MDSSNKQKLGDLLDLMKRCSVKSSDKALSKEIISALRNGIAPNRGVLEFSVGREDLLNLVKQDLGQVKKGTSRLRFINGRYGSGKTHGLFLLRELAFENNFASSFITLTPRETPIYDLGTVYRHIIKGLRTKNCQDMPALETIIKKWSEKIFEMGYHGIQIALREIKRLSLDFQSVLTYYLESSKVGSWQKADFAIRWIQGELQNMRDAKRVTARSFASDQTALGMIQNIVLMLRIIGFNGLVVLIDEAETIRSIPTLSKIHHAYENISKLINCNLETSHSYFVYATTSEFFQDSAGYINLTFPENSLITLQPLPKSALQKLAMNIRDIHIQSYRWPNIIRLSNQSIMKFVDKFLELSEEGRLARNFVKAMIASLDICQENPKLLVSQTLSQRN